MLLPMTYTLLIFVPDYEFPVRNVGRIVIVINGQVCNLKFCCGKFKPLIYIPFTILVVTQMILAIIMINRV